MEAMPTTTLCGVRTARAQGRGTTFTLRVGASVYLKGVAEKDTFSSTNGDRGLAGYRLEEVNLWIVWLGYIQIMVGC